MSHSATKNTARRPPSWMAARTTRIQNATWAIQCPAPTAPTSRPRRGVDSERMPRLVDLNLDATRQRDHRHDAIPVVLRLAMNGDSPGAQVADGGVDVVTHQRQLVLNRRRPLPFRWMYSELGGRQREDQPSLAGVDVPELEDVAEYRAQGLCLWRVQQHVSADDGHGYSSRTTNKKCKIQNAKCKREGAEIPASSSRRHAPCLSVCILHLSFCISRSRPDAEQPADEDDLADVVRRVVDNEQDFAQAGLPRSVRDRREQIDAGVARQRLHRLAIAPVGRYALLPCLRRGGRRGCRPVVVGPLHLAVL